MKIPNLNSVGPTLRKWITHPPTLGIAALFTLICRAIFFSLHSFHITVEYQYRVAEQIRSFMSGEIPLQWELNGYFGAVTLPPGYPIFLALLAPFSGPELSLFFYAQFLLAVASSLLVFSAIHPSSKKLAWISLCLLNLSPWIGRQVSALHPEILGFFLASLLIYLLSRYEEGVRTTGNFLLLGLTAAALHLTTPAASIMSGGIILILAYKERFHRKQAFVLIIASFLPLLVWQGYLFPKTHQISLTGYTHHPRAWTKSEFGRWFKAWSVGEENLPYIWSPPQMTQLPPQSYVNESQKQEIQEALTGYFNHSLNWEEFDRRFEKIASKSIQANPLRYYLTLPLIRVFSLWTHGSAVSVWNMDRAKRFVLSGPEEGFDLHDLISFMVFAALGLINSFLFCTTAAGVYRQPRNPFPWLILLSLIGYTAISVWVAAGEGRRNTPFYPLLCYALIYSVSRRRSVERPETEEILMERKSA